jgi:hypothetical protein
VGPSQLGGLFDGYYRNNGNNPSTGRTNIRNFDVGADSFDVKMAKVFGAETWSRDGHGLA